MLNFITNNIMILYHEENVSYNIYIYILNIITELRYKCVQYSTPHAITTNAICYLGDYI